MSPRLLLLLGAVVVVLLSVLTFRYVDARAADREGVIADQAASAVALTFAGIESDLIAAQVEVPSLGGVSPEAFDAYARDEVERGVLLTLAFAPLVTDDERPDWEASTGITIVDREGPGTFVPAAERARYAPVQYVYPKNDVSTSITGFDLLGQADRQPAVERALNDGRPRATTPSGLATSDDPGLVIFQPLQAGGTASRVTTGVVASFIAGSALHERLQSVLPTDTTVAVGQGDRMLFGVASEDATARRVEALGQPLDVMVTAQPTIAPIVPAAAVGLIGALAGGLTLLAGRNREQARQRRRERQANATNLRLVAERLSSAATSQEVIDAIHDYLDRRIAVACDIRLTVLERDRPTLVVTPAQAPSPPPYVPSESLRSSLPDGGTMVLDLWFPSPLDETGPLDSVRAVAAMASQALARSIDFDRQREALDALQQSLLPKDLPALSDAWVEALYVPSATRDIGGDWFDVHRLSDGSVILVIGDVVGRGFAAATTMGRLRVACDIASLEPGTSPADVLSTLNEYCLRTTATYTATCLVLCIEADGCMNAASAGHIDPMRIADSTLSVWPVPPGPALGLSAQAEFPVTEGKLEAGQGVLLLTDGMVERRDEPIDVSLERAASALSGLAAQGLIDTLAEVLTPERDDDAAALLYVREPPASAVVRAQNSGAN